MNLANDVAASLPNLSGPQSMNISLNPAETQASRVMMPAEAATRDAAAPLFSLDAMSFSVGASALLRPLSLQIPAGRMIGLIGHNGSGKSTLVKLLARQETPSSGAIGFAGRPLADWGDRELARKLAYLPQTTAAASGMLAAELVALGRYPWHGALGRVTKADREKIAEAMALTDVEGFAARDVETLSGGERQRVWLAMLVAQDAECLLLDEPISALDVAHQVEVLSLVRRLAETRGIGVVVVLHDVNMAARFCDEIVALHTGRLIARGTPEEIMRPDRLKAIYGIDMGILAHPDGGGPIGYVR